MNAKLHAAKHVESARNGIIERAVQAGFGTAVVPALLDFLIDELVETPEAIQTRHLSNGPLALDIALRQASMNGDPVTLTPIEFRLVEYFVRRAGVVVPNRQILCDIWGKNAEGHTQYLRVYVGQIRRKLGQEVIKNRPGEGYYMGVL